MISEFKKLFGEWIAAVARDIAAIRSRFIPQRKIFLVEGDDATFTAKAMPLKKGASLQDVSFRLPSGRPIPPLPEEWVIGLRGSHLEVTLKPDGILFRPLDFPKQAAEFLDGMIRAQIDRLTPWAARDAVFGWSPPTDGAERIQLTLAATSKSKIEPFVQFASDVGAASLAALVKSQAGEGAPAPVKVFETSLQHAVGQAMGVPRILRIILLGSGVAAAASLLVAAYLGSTLDAKQQELSQKIAQRRAAMRIGQTAAEGSAQSLLTKRKQTTPSSVMVLEALSRALPDNTYVTELRLEGEKAQVVGISQDAPSLIRLMEQSPQFSRATFFAPTTRGHGDPGERFHIEVHVTPYFGSAS